MVKIFSYVAWSNTGVSALLLSLLENNCGPFDENQKRV